ncbi:hypothetical protein L7F22_068368 [Adiantum nelumboides]|nr:hypothetical protein [Adiantum nelumboides]
MAKEIHVQLQAQKLRDMEEKMLQAQQALKELEEHNRTLSMEVASSHKTLQVKEQQLERTKNHKELIEQGMMPKYLVQSLLDIDNMDEEDEDEDDDNEDQQIEGTSGHDHGPDNDENQDDPPSGTRPSVGGATIEPSNPPSSQSEAPSPASQGDNQEDMGAASHGGGSQKHMVGKEIVLPEGSIATLADASKQDVNKLLGRAGARGAAARAKGSANCNAAQKRGRKTTFPEGEENLYFQRNEKGDVKPPENLSVCGALASTLVDVKYGSSSGHSVLQESVTTMEHDIPKVSTHGLGLLKDVKYTGLKSGDAHECSSMEDGCEWEVGSTVFDGSNQEEEKAWDGEINIEMDMSVPDSSGQKAGKRFLRRANAKDKEFAELVHKAHLLCMISRGRLVDVACDDPVLQASLLSIVPDHVHFQDRQQVSISQLGRFVKWGLRETLSEVRK